MIQCVESYFCTSTRTASAAQPFTGRPLDPSLCYISRLLYFHSTAMTKHGSRNTEDANLLRIAYSSYRCVRVTMQTFFIRFSTCPGQKGSVSIKTHIFLLALKQASVAFFLFWGWTFSTDGVNNSIKAREKNALGWEKDTITLRHWLICKKEKKSTPNMNIL